MIASTSNGHDKNPLLLNGANASGMSSAASSHVDNHFGGVWLVVVSVLCLVGLWVSATATARAYTAADSVIGELTSCREQLSKSKDWNTLVYMELQRARKGGQTINQTIDNIPPPTQ